MVTAWWSSHCLIHYSFMKPGQLITAETYCNQLDHMMKNLPEQQPRLVKADRLILLQMCFYFCLLMKLYRTYISEPISIACVSRVSISRQMNRSTNSCSFPKLCSASLLFFFWSVSVSSLAFLRATLILLIGVFCQ